MAWLRFPAICFIDGGMQPLLHAMILKAFWSASKSALLLVNQDLALKTSSFFALILMLKVFMRLFQYLFHSVSMVSWPYSQSFQLLASFWGFHEHHHWHLQEILQLGHQSTSRLSLRGESTGNFPQKHWRHTCGRCHHPEKTWLMNMFCIPSCMALFYHTRNIAWFVQYMFFDRGGGWHLWSAL